LTRFAGAFSRDGPWVSALDLGWIRIGVFYGGATALNRFPPSTPSTVRWASASASSIPPTSTARTLTRNSSGRRWWRTRAQGLRVAGKAATEIQFRAVGNHLEGSVAVHVAADADQKGAALDACLVRGHCRNSGRQGEREERSDRQDQAGRGFLDWPSIACGMTRRRRGSVNQSAGVQAQILLAAAQMASALGA